MNLLGIVIVVFCFTISIRAAPAPCAENPDVEDEKVCDETEYEAYRACVEAARSGGGREKRQAGSPCRPRVVEPFVQTVEPFELLLPVQPLKIVQRPELKNLDRTIILQQGSNQIDEDGDDDGTDADGSFHYRLPVNVTTVIRLTNIVNNTNNIHMPTTLNNTNVNNIHVYSNLTEVAAGDVPRASCCTAVRPQSCHTSTQGVHCKHRKFQTCGPQCTAKVVHVQKRKRCRRSSGECKEKIAYVPQPEKPTCVYIDEWPYVVCGKVANMSVICDGCYDHYGRGYEAVHGHARMQPQCYGCYDDAFDVGPLYRRGPVLRPFFYHQAPCYLSGSCPDSYDDCGYGCYGHDRVDPAWGYRPDVDPYDPETDSSNTIYYDPDSLETANDTSNDWGVPAAKCAVVTDDDAVMVKNCTDSINNPYVAAPATYPYYHKLLKSHRKNGTHRPPTTIGEVTEGPSTAGVSTDTPTRNTTTTIAAGSSTTTAATQGPDEDEDEETTISTVDGPSTDTTTVDSMQTDNEEYDGNDGTDDTEVVGSGAGPRNNEVSFVEEYIDDEDFTL